MTTFKQVASKKVLEFAAKDQVTPDSQRDWQRWQSKPKNDESSTVGGENKRLHVDETLTKSEEDWVVLEDSEGKRYRFNKSSGETSYDLKEDDSSSEEEAEEGAEYEQQPEPTTKPSPPVPPQVWEKQLNSLTRKTNWYCAEIDVTLDRAPLPHPWRAVKAPPENKVYFWNTETNETKWPS